MVLCSSLSIVYFSPQMGYSKVFYATQYLYVSAAAEETAGSFSTEHMM